MEKRILISVILLLVGCAKETTKGRRASEQTEAETPAPETSPPKSAKHLEGAPSNPTWNVDESGFVLHGYDPISYHHGKPQKGHPEFVHVWDGVKWNFSSQRNLEMFAKSPEQYTPALGGYCTFGIVIDKKFDGDPKVWLVQNGKTHVFLNEDVKAKFLQDPDNWIMVARKWAAFLQTRIPSEL